MAIQNRRGLKKDFDLTKMLPGEWAVTIDPETENQMVYMCFSPGVVKRMGTYEDFKNQVDEATWEIKEEYLAAVESASSEAITKITEGVASVEASAAEIAADREQIQTNKTDISNLEKLAVTPTATGSQIVARDSAEWPLQALTVYGRTEQVTTSGAQLLAYPYVTSNSTYSGLTATAENGHIKISGTTTAGTNFYFMHNVPVGNYGLKVSKGFTGANLLVHDYTGGVDLSFIGSGSSTRQITFSVTDEHSVSIYFNFSSAGLTADIDVDILLTTADLVDTAPFEPYTGGKPAPSPDYPQPIVSAGCRLSTGKNLFNASSREVRAPGGNSQNTETRSFNGSGIYVGLSGNNYYYPSNVTSYEVDDNSVTLCTVQSAYGIAFDFKTVPGQTYTIGNELSEKVGLSFYTEQGAFIEYSENNKSCTATAPDNAYWMIVLFRPTQGTSYTYTNIQLEKGTSATAYEPYTGGVPAAYPRGVEVALTGKNLLDDRYYSAEYQRNIPRIKSRDIIVLPFSPQKETDGVCKVAKCKKGQTYTFSCTNANANAACCMAEYDSIDNAMDISKAIGGVYMTSVRLEMSYTAKSDGILVCGIMGKWTNGTTTLHECTESELLQLELNSTATTYEPYRGRQTITLASNGLPGIQVSDGKSYADTIEYRNGQAVYVQRVWSKTFTGGVDEAWYKYNSQEYTGFMSLQTLPEAYKRAPGFCDMLSVHTGGAAGIEGLWLGVESRDMYVHNSSFYDATLEDKGLSNWRAYLAAHPMTVMTYLTTPIETPLTAAEAAQLAALHTYKPTTTIVNNAGVEMEVEYVADTKAYIDNKFAELQSSIATTNAQLI